MDTVRTWMKQHDEKLEKTTGMLSDTNKRVEKLEKRVKEGLDKCEARATIQQRPNRIPMANHQISSQRIRLEELERQVEENHDWTKNNLNEIREYYNAGAGANNGNDL